MKAVTIRQLRIYLALGLLAVLLAGYGNDHTSCLRSAYWVRHDNLQAAALRNDANVAMQFAQANVTDPTKQRLDIKQATADMRQADALKTAPLTCFPIPQSPRHGVS